MKQTSVLVSAIILVSGLLSCNKVDDRNKPKGMKATRESDGNPDEFKRKHPKEVVVYIANEPTEGIPVPAGKTAQPLLDDSLYVAVHGKEGDASRTGDVAQLSSAICGKAADARTKELFVVTNKDLKLGKIRRCVATPGGSLIDIPIDLAAAAKGASQPLTFTDGQIATVLTQVLTKIHSMLNEENIPGRPNNTAVSLILKSHGSGELLMLGCRRETIPSPLALSTDGKDTLGTSGNDSLNRPGTEDPLGSRYCAEIGLTALQINNSIPLKMFFSGTVFLESCQSALAGEVSNPVAEEYNLKVTLKTHAYSLWTSDLTGLVSKTITDYTTMMSTDANPSFAVKLNQALRDCTTSRTCNPNPSDAVIIPVPYSAR